jgi:hypothetical protein
VFVSYNHENIAGKINKFLEEKVAETEEVIDIRYQHPLFSLLVIQTIR